MSDWSDTPPTVAGTYWVKCGEEEVIGCFDPAESEQWVIGDDAVPTKYLVDREYQFGHRIPTNWELDELPGLIEEYAEQCANLGTEDGIADAKPEMWQAMLGNRGKIKSILGGWPNDAGED